MSPEPAVWTAIKNPLPISANSFLSCQADSSLIQISYFQCENRIRADVFFGARSEGPPGHVHGGALAAVLDEVMGSAAWVGAFPVLTGRITIDYHAMLAINTTVKVETEIEAKTDRKVQAKGYIVSEDGKIIYASGIGTFVKLADEKYAQLLKILNADKKPHRP